MNEVTGLIVDIEARTAKLERGLKRANDRQRQAAGQMERRAQQSARRIENTYERMTNNIGAGFKKMIGPAAALAGIASLTQLARKAHDLAEEYRAVENTLRAIGQTSDEAAEKLAASAIRSGSNMRDMGQTIMRIQKATNGGYDETIRRVETLNKLLTVGGASTAEVNSVSLQLSQALSSGVLQGDELRSLREAAPVELLDAIARAAGGTRSQLKDMGAEGKLTTAVMLTALDQMAASADANFSKMTMTSDRAWQNMNTGLTTFVGRLDEGLGASERLATGVNDLAVFLNDNAEAAEQFGLSFVAALETAEQIAGDAKRALDDLADTIHQNTTGAVFDLGDAFGDTGLTIGQVLDQIIDGLATFSGAMGGSAEAAAEAFKKIPDAITGAMQGAINAVISGVETMINKVLEGVRTVAQAVDDLTAKIPGTDGTNLASGIGPVSLGRATGLKSSYSSRSISDAYAAGYERDRQGFLDAVGEVSGYFSDAMGDVRDRFNENRARLEAEAAAKDAERGAQGGADGDDAGSSDEGAGGKDGKGKGRKGAAEKLNDFQREAQRIKERTAALQAEAATLEAVAAGNVDYGDALEFARTKAELLVAAQKAGLTITPELEAEIDKLADAYVQAGLKAEGAAQKLDEIRERGQRGKDALTDMFGSILDGSKSAKQAVADLLLEIAKMQMLKAIFQIPGMGGIANTVGGLMGGFSEGGFTGPGTKHQPAGIVHAGEFVFSAESVKRLGAANLDQMHRAAKTGRMGYASGGLVSATGKVNKAISGRSGQSGESSAPVVNITGGPITVTGSAGTAEQNSDLAKQIARESEAAMRALVQTELVRQMRPGGLLR